MQVTIEIQQITTHTILKCVLTSRKSRSFYHDDWKIGSASYYVDLHPRNVRCTKKALTFLKGVCILVFIIGRRSQKDDQDIFV